MKRKLRSILAGLALSFSGISTAAPELVVQSGMGSAPVIAEKPASADGAALIDWFPAITTTALLGISLWLSRKLKKESVNENIIVALFAVSVRTFYFSGYSKRRYE